MALDEFMMFTDIYSGTILIILFVAITHYFLFLYKGKWKDYVEEFEYLTNRQRRKGTFLLIFYLVFSVVLSFSPFYFLEMDRNKIRQEQRTIDSIRVYDSYGIGKCTSIDKGNNEDFAFYEFYVKGKKVKGTTTIEKGSGEGFSGNYFRVNYSSKKNRESILLVKDPVTEYNKIKKAGFSFKK